MLNGITRDSILDARQGLGIPVVEQALPRELLYICDEAFFTGTAAEVTHLRSVDRILVGDGTMGPITTALHKAFFDIVNGTRARPLQLAHPGEGQSRGTRRGLIPSQQAGGADHRAGRFVFAGEACHLSRVPLVSARTQPEGREAQRAVTTVRRA